MFVVCRKIEEDFSRKKIELELEKKELEEEHQKSLESCQRFSFGEFLAALPALCNHFYRSIALKEAELLKNMEEEKQGVEEERRKVVKMKEDLEKERLRRAMGVNFHKKNSEIRDARE